METQLARFRDLMKTARTSVTLPCVPTGICRLYNPNRVALRNVAVGRMTGPLVNVGYRPIADIGRLLLSDWVRSMPQVGHRD
jgi:hypothetical protein